MNRLALLAVLGQVPKDWQELLNESARNARERFQKERGTKTPCLTLSRQQTSPSSAR